MSITKKHAAKKSSKSHSSDSSSESDVPVKKKKKSDSKKSKGKEKTYVIEQKYKGTKTIAIFKGEEDDHEEGSFPVVAFGLTKAKAIIKHYDDIKAWVKSQERDDDE